MSDEKPETWPLLPSRSAYLLEGVCLALADVAREEAGRTISRRALLKLNGLAMTAELLSGEVAHFFGSRMYDDHDQLEALQDRYLDEVRRGR